VLSFQILTDRPSEMTADLYNTLKIMEFVAFLHILCLYLNRNQNYFWYQRIFFKLRLLV
jgi:hypothetical protein